MTIFLFNKKESNLEEKNLHRLELSKKTEKGVVKFIGCLASVIFPLCGLIYITRSQDIATKNQDIPPFIPAQVDHKPARTTVNEAARMIMGTGAVFGVMSVALVIFINLSNVIKAKHVFNEAKLLTDIAKFGAKFGGNVSVTKDELDIVRSKAEKINGVQVVGFKVLTEIASDADIERSTVIGEAYNYAMGAFKQAKLVHERFSEIDKNKYMSTCAHSQISRYDTKVQKELEETRKSIQALVDVAWEYFQEPTSNVIALKCCVLDPWSEFQKTEETYGLL